MALGIWVSICWWWGGVMRNSKHMMMTDDGDDVHGFFRRGVETLLSAWWDMFLDNLHVFMSILFLHVPSTIRLVLKHHRHSACPYIQQKPEVKLRWNVLDLSSPRWASMVVAPVCPCYILCMVSQRCSDPRGTLVYWKGLKVSIWCLQYFYTLAWKVVSPVSSNLELSSCCSSRCLRLHHCYVHM